MAKQEIRDPVLGALHYPVWRVMQDAWDDPSPRNIEKVARLLEKYGGSLLNSPELVQWVKRHRREIMWAAAALGGQVAP